MSFDSKYGRYCDECGRTILKAHRIFKQHDYCGTCYPKVFIARECVKCGASARMHRHSQEDPVCKKCSLANRTCQRCDKSIVKAGMISEGKPVCPSCVPHFRVSQPCGRCNKLSTRLSTMPSFGIKERICDSCRNKLTHATCSMCGRYRKVGGGTAEGTPHCSSCMPGQISTHACPDCRAAIPGRGTGRCRSCLNRNQLEKEVRLHVASLNHDWTQKQCTAFAQWLWGRQKGRPSLVKTYRSHQQIFERLDVNYSEAGQVTAEALLLDFGPAELRRHQLMVEFLGISMGVKLSAKSKAETADQERIRTKLLEHAKLPWGSVLADYAAWLKKENIAVRTCRMYVSTAAGFCSEVKVENGAWRVEKSLAYLRRHPGSRANLHKFVRYCACERSWDVRMPPSDAAVRTRTRMPATVRQLHKLLVEANNVGLEAASKQLLRRILAKSLGLTIAEMNTINAVALVGEIQGLSFEIGSEKIIVPPELLPLARAYLGK